MDTERPAEIIDLFFTKAQAAEELGKSEATLDRWNRLRVGPPRTKLGRTVLYRRDTLKAWLIAQEEAEVQRPRMK
jgi:hypothetical protein